MDLNELYGRVSEAISEAESLDALGRKREAARAHMRASRLEEEIARLLPASDPEGALARQGAVAAALGAGDPSRAAERARVYLAEAGLSERFRAEIETLVRAAEADLCTLQRGREPAVVPVRFKFAA